MLAGIVTLIALAAFLGGVAWAMSGKRKREFDEAARLPLEDDAPATLPPGNGDRTDTDGRDS